MQARRLEAPDRRMFRSWFGAALGAVVALHCAAAVAMPAITGPLPGAAIPGDASRDHPFFATTLPLSTRRYTEQEFFMEGAATRFSTACPQVVCPPESSNEPVNVVSAGHPYKVRLIVRRPTDPAAFNGKVIVEWLNVYYGYEVDLQWSRAADYFMRKGFAYVGVGVQQDGIHSPQGLRAWNPQRYGTLDVTAGGTIGDDSLKWDIFNQAGQAILHPAGVDPLGGLPAARTLIATGDSRSSANLMTYLNTVHRLDPLYAGAVVAGPLGIPLRDDVTTKVIKLPAEWDVIQFEAGIRRPDSANLISWEVAGMAHSPYQTYTALAETSARDVGQSTGVMPGLTQCGDPARSRVHSHFVHHAAYDWMVRWLSGERPPSMPAPLVPSAGTANGDFLARGDFGLAVGGIRLPDITVPAATNTGWNTGGKAGTPDILCQHAGSFVPFGDTTLRALYASHDDYVSKVSAAAAANVQQGFLLPEDADTIVADADKSDVLAAPRADGSVRVVEFYHPVNRRYFWSSDPAERAAIDFQGAGGDGWFRTGETFFAWPAAGPAPGNSLPVCRLSGALGIGPFSHFFSPDPRECGALMASGVWVEEGLAFRAPVECAAGQDPVVRLWSPGPNTHESRHRFVVRDSVMAEAVANGFMVEGAVFCGAR